MILAGIKKVQKVTADTIRTVSDSVKSISNNGFNEFTVEDLLKVYNGKTFIIVNKSNEEGLYSTWSDNTQDLVKYLHKKVKMITPEVNFIRIYI